MVPYIEHQKFKDVVLKMTLDDMKRYMRALLEALHHLHSRGVLHRDVKPGNFLCDFPGDRFVLADFGLAEIISTNTIDTNNNNTIDTNNNNTPTPMNTISNPMTSNGILSIDNIPNNIPKLSAHTITITTNTPTAHTKSVHTKLQDENIETASKKRKINSHEAPAVPMIHRDVKKLKTSGNSVDPHYLRRCTSQESSITSSKNSNSKNNSKNSNSNNNNNNNNRGKVMHAPRAGTRGFRAPEILLKCPVQTTAIDIWSAGIIFLCILSTRYPFFNSPDDLASLAEIAAVFGTQQLTSAAYTLGRRLHFPSHVPPTHLRSLCES